MNKFGEKLLIFQVFAIKFKNLMNDQSKPVILST